LLNVCLEQRVEAKVDTKTGPIVGVRQKDVVSVFNILVPAHKPHLQAQDGGIPPVIRQDKLDCIAICHPSESLTKAHVAVFVNGPIADKSFSEMRVQFGLVATCPGATKCDGVKNSRRSLCHKIEALATHATIHGG
jgi:hypothetical protein